MPNDQPHVTEAPISVPEFESLTVEVRRSGTDPLSAARAAVERAWARVATGARGSEAWTVEPVHPSRPEAFDLLAPAALDVTIGKAWNLAYALRQETDVLDAEPSFEISLDNAPDAEELAAGPVAGLASSSDTTEGAADDHPDWSPEQIKRRRPGISRQSPAAKAVARASSSAIPTAAFVRTTNSSIPRRENPTASSPCWEWTF